MRIRTIKPEFWASETIATLSDAAKLLAIGLLNYCDDEGFFCANPVLIRASIFPFHDSSKNVLGWLQELARAGYVQLGLSGCGTRQVGKVVNFITHQRIDRPKPSIIGVNCKFDDQSTIIQRTVADGSLLEGNGREGNREQGTEGNRERSRAVFVRPEIDEVKLWAAKAGLPETEAFKFHAYYESNGWKVGRNPMKSWHGAMSTWKLKWEEQRNGTHQHNPQSNGRRLTGAEQRQVGIPPSRGLGAAEIVRLRTAQKQRERDALQAAQNGVATAPVQPQCP